MRVLFAVFLLSLVALIVTLLALRRHIRNHGSQPADSFQLAGAPHEDSLNQNDQR